MTVEVVVKCNLCGTKLKGDNTDSWATKLPLASKPPAKEEYTITKVDVCFPCKDALGDWVKDRIGK
jgi:hypothetical protein